MKGAVAFAREIIRGFSVHSEGPGPKRVRFPAAICSASSSAARFCRNRHPGGRAANLGLDAGAAAAIRQALLDLADRGARWW